MNLTCNILILVINITHRALLFILLTITDWAGMSTKPGGTSDGSTTKLLLRINEVNCAVTVRV